MFATSVSCRAVCWGSGRGVQCRDIIMRVPSLGWMHEVWSQCHTGLLAGRWIENLVWLTRWHNSQVAVSNSVNHAKLGFVCDGLL